MSCAPDTATKSRHTGSWRRMNSVKAAGLSSVTAQPGILAAAAVAACSRRTAAGSVPVGTEEQYQNSMSMSVPGSGSAMPGRRGQGGARRGEQRGAAPHAEGSRSSRTAMPSSPSAAG